MASDLPPVRTSGDASAADDAPSTSSAPSGGRRVKLMCAYGGKFLPRPIDGCLRYAGGETRIINLRRDSSLPEFLRKMAEAYGGPVAVRYQLPEEDLDALISVSTPEDLDNMMEEVDKIAENNPSAKLRVFLFSPAELAGASMDQHYPGKDIQDQNTRYIEAVNGVGNRLPRKDSMASVSTQNSDGAIGAEAAADGLDEGTLPTLPPPNAMNAHDQPRPFFAVQNMPDLPTAISSIEQNEVFNATQSELPPAGPYLQQSHVDPHNSQFMSSQPFAVSALHSQVNATPLPPPTYALATHGTLPTFSQPGNGVPVQRREGPILEEKTSVGRIAKVPSDPIFPVQNMPDLPTAISCIDQNEVFNATQLELPPSLQQSYVGPHHSQVMSSQPFSVAGLHSQVNMAPLLPPSYVPATRGTLPPTSQPGNVLPVQRREDPVLEEKMSLGNTAKVPSDPKLSVQNMPNLPTASSSIDQNEIFNVTRSELPPVSPYLKQSYVDPHHSQFMSSQSFAVGGLHSEVNTSSLPPPPYVAAMHGTLSPTSQPGNVMPVQRREDSVLEEKASVGNTAKVPGDLILSVQNMPNLPTAISSIDQNETFKATQSEIPLGAPYLQQTYVDPYNSQFISSQPFAVTGLHSHVNVAPLPPQSYVPATRGTLPLISQPGNGVPVQRREDTLLEEKTNVGKIAKVPDPNLQSLSQPQLPPLPPAHFLTPKGQALRLEECSLCQKSLPHAHSETAINDQVNGSRISNSEAKPVLQSHHSEDIMRTRVPQVDVIGALADNMTETNPGNLVSPASFVNYEMPCNSERANVLVTNNLDQMKTLGQESTASAVSSQAAHVTVTNLQTSHQDATMQKNQALHAFGSIREDNSHSIFLCQPTLSIRTGEMLNGPPKSSWEEELQGQSQISQNKIQLKQESSNQPLVTDISSLRNPNLQEGVLAQFNKPVEEMVGTFGPSALNDQPKQVVVPKMATSKYSRPDILPSVIEKSIAAKPLDEPTVPLNDLLLTSGVVPNGSSCLPADAVASTGQNFLYIQHPQAARAGNTFHTTENNPIVNVGKPDYTHSSMMNKHPMEHRKYDTSKSQAKEVFGATMIPHNVDAQIITDTQPFQGQISSNSLFFNDDPQKILGSAPVLSPSSADVSTLESIVMKEMQSDIQPLHTKDSVDMVLEGVSAYPSQASKDLRTELIRPLKDYEHIEQDMPASAEETVAPIVSLSKPSVNDFAPHHPNNEETGSTENSVERADEEDKTIKGTKKPEKFNNGFPSMDDIGRHLQIIKNSDLEELRELGSGTFGTVYHGKWRGSDVAIKRLNELVFKGKPSDQERARADFWNEAHKLSSLHHPNVVAFYGIVLDGPGGTIATVTEFMVNGSLRNALVKNDKTLDWRKRLLIAMDVAFGMEYLHSRNIIHFDLKSDNLLVNLRDPQRPICKVGDLGLSRVKFETLMSGGMRGTLPWMAPELLDGKTKCTEKIDVYSFGIVMWELLTGEEPYADLHYGAIIGGIIKNTLRPTVPENCNAEWRSLMEQCWSVEPTERPNFTEIASRLRAMGASIPKRG